MLSGIYDETAVTVGAVRVDGRITDNSWGNRELIQRGSKFVRYTKTQALKQRERDAARRKRKGD